MSSMTMSLETMLSLRMAKVSSVDVDSTWYSYPKGMRE